jgi:hypothetical protein
MGEYTPTIAEIRDAFCGSIKLASKSPAENFHIGARLFDRWLNAERARIWEQCAQEGWEAELYGHKRRDKLMARNPYEADA